MVPEWNYGPFLDLTPEPEWSNVTSCDNISCAWAQVLHPLSRDKYFKSYFDQVSPRPLHIRRGKNGVENFFVSSLGDLDSVDGVLQAQRHLAYDVELLIPNTNNTQADCSWVMSSMDSDPNYSDLYEAYLNGHTIVCNIVGSYYPPLAKLLKNMNDLKTGFAYQANLYLSPGGMKQGFSSHNDNKDGIIIQIHGSKHWVVRETKFPLPLRQQLVGRSYQPPTTVHEGQVIFNGTIERGDTLLVPRGTIHYCVSNSLPSMHYTISPVKNLEWITVLGAISKNSEGAESTLAYLERISNSAEGSWLRSSVVPLPGYENMLHNDGMPTNAMMKSVDQMIDRLSKFSIHFKKLKKQLKVKPNRSRQLVANVCHENKVFTDYTARITANSDARFRQALPPATKYKYTGVLLVTLCAHNAKLICVSCEGSGQQATIPNRESISELLHFLKQKVESTIVVSDIVSLTKIKLDTFEAIALVRHLESKGILQKVV
eukprot:UC4_evm5s1462